MTLSHLITIAEYEIYSYHLISLQNIENERGREEDPNEEHKP